MFEQNEEMKRQQSQARVLLRGKTMAEKQNLLKELQKHKEKEAQVSIMMER